MSKLLQFDQRGLLTPYKRVSLKLEEFEAFFVREFPLSSSRKEIFTKYLSYLGAFQRAVSPNFTHWLDGSFLTKKENPRDLDFVTLLDFSVVKQKEALLREKFLKDQALDFFGLDAYLVEVFPEGHPNHFITKLDLAYWNSWFSRTSENRAGRSYLKGFVEISFSS